MVYNISKSIQIDIKMYMFLFIFYLVSIKLLTQLILLILNYLL